MYDAHWCTWFPGSHTTNNHTGATRVPRAAAGRVLSRFHISMKIELEFEENLSRRSRWGWIWRRGRRAGDVSTSMGYLWRLVSQLDGPSDLLELLTGLGGGFLLPTGGVPRSHAGSAGSRSGYWRRVGAPYAAVTRMYARLLVERL